MSIFLISLDDNELVGFVNDESASEAQPEAFKVSNVDDLLRLSESKLFDLYNSFTGSEDSFSKLDLADKIFEYLENYDISKIISLNKKQEEKIEKTPATPKKDRKVRNTKLQRMRSAFLETNEDGSYKIWTIKELIEKIVGEIRSEEDYKKEYNVAKVYISYLKSPKDRFIMNIVHDKKAGTYCYAP